MFNNKWDPEGEGLSWVGVQPWLYHEFRSDWSMGEHSVSQKKKREGKGKKKKRKKKERWMNERMKWGKKEDESAAITDYYGDFTYTQIY